MSKNKGNPDIFYRSVDDLVKAIGLSRQGTYRVSLLGWGAAAWVLFSIVGGGSARRYGR
jgi:hypothetical protein